ncbi:hypothetical protein [Bowmanella dokdonensis]|uniref:ABC-type transport auxiliary lipoprotein component domain-containing protein n=1 Tax=Bowmanella dokdonensis TaxID=751969 RepID=A0A939DS55_9ALTE|nr:hypothetical protein [Bowmanella dokdonensis]MBN7827795.1 hypothetical protein [Bowmanella dokdonensis]
MMLKRFFVLFFILGMMSCASLTPLDFNIDKSYLPKLESTYLFSDIRVKPARVKERVAPREIKGEDWIDQPMGILASQQWESSLADLFQNPEDTSSMGVARESVFLTVEIQRLSWNGLMGVDVATRARYKVINPMTGELIFSTVVDSLGSASSTEAFVGANRMRIALVNSIKRNIEVFATSFGQHISGRS